MEQLNKFFQDYPAITKQQFCREAEITARSLYYYMSGERKPKGNTRNRITAVMKKYGYKGAD